MLGDHDRGRILGAWTGARTEGEQVVAEGMRFVSDEVEPQVTRYRGLLEEGVLWGVSIGFTGRWFYVPELPDSDPVKETGAVWLIEGTEEHPIEVYEASLVTIGADAESMVTYQFDAGEVAPAREAGNDGDAALEMEPEDERVVEGIAGALMLRHLVDDHGMESEAAEDAVRRMLAGEDPDVIEDEAGDEHEAAEMASSEGEKEDGVFFDVPAGLSEAAKKGLDDAEEYGRAEGGPGAATARALISGRVSAEKIVEMVVWWARWEDAEKPAEPESDGGPSATEIRWDQWGGNPEGARWARDNEDAAREEIGESGDDGEQESGEMSDTPATPPATFADFLSAVPEHPSAATFADFLAAGCS